MKKIIPALLIFTLLITLISCNETRHSVTYKNSDDGYEKIIVLDGIDDEVSSIEQKVIQYRKDLTDEEYSNLMSRSELLQRTYDELTAAEYSIEEDEGKIIETITLSTGGKAHIDYLVRKLVLPKEYVSDDKVYFMTMNTILAGKGYKEVTDENN